MSATEKHIKESYLHNKNIYDDYSGMYYRYKSELETLEKDAERLKGWLKDYKERMEDAEAEMSKLEVMAKENQITL
jgi:predicted nuclease with TOPRIM domain